MGMPSGRGTSLPLMGGGAATVMGSLVICAAAGTWGGGRGRWWVEGMATGLRFGCLWESSWCVEARSCCWETTNVGVAASERRQQGGRCASCPPYTHLEVTEHEHGYKGKQCCRRQGGGAAAAATAPPPGAAAAASCAARAINPPAFQGMGW